MSKQPAGARRFFGRFLSALGLILVLLRPGLAQRAAPNPGLMPSANPLCDGPAVPCLEIDDLAGHAYAQAQLLPHTDLRDTAAALPLGIALHLFGRLAGSISTHYLFWTEGSTNYQQFGPLRLNLTAHIFPIFPLGVSRSSPQSGAPAPSHYTPPRGLQLGLSYEHEVRAWRFDGANSLGLLTDLASLRVLGSRIFGPVQLSASLGALFDWRGRFATGELAAHLGLYLPGFPALKLYVEALGRGFPAQLQADALLPEPDGHSPIHPQGMLDFGLSFRPHARVDLGVAIQRGFGGLAPWAVSVQFLTLSVGKSYQGRAAAPVVQLVAAAATEAVVQLREFIAQLPIDPQLDEDCQILDHDNVTVLGQFSKKTLNGYYCEHDGFLVPIRHELNRDRKGTRLCRDSQLQDCLLQRHGRTWVAVHRPRLDGACRMSDSDGTILGVLGEPTRDGRHCRYAAAHKNGRYGAYTEYQEQPVGTLFYTDAARTAVCADEAMQHCFLAPAAGRTTLAWGNHERASTALAGGVRDGLVEQASAAKAQAIGVALTTRDVATGKVQLSTLYREAKQAAVGAVISTTDFLQDPEKRAAAIRAAGDRVDRLQRSIQAWNDKPPEEQLEDSLRAGGRLSAHAATTVLLGGSSRAALEGLGLANTALKGAEAEAAIAHGVKRGRKTIAALEHHGDPKALPPAPQPRGLLPGRAAAISPPEPGRFIVDPRGNVLIEPKGGSTYGNIQGTFVETRYPNGSSAYQLHEAHPKRGVYEPHGHHRGPGKGPEEQHWGPSLDKDGHIVPYNSAAAHWDVKK